MQDFSLFNFEVLNQLYFYKSIPEGPLIFDNIFSDIVSDNSQRLLYAHYLKISTINILQQRPSGIFTNNKCNIMTFTRK